MTTLSMFVSIVSAKLAVYLSSSLVSEESLSSVFKISLVFGFQHLNSAVSVYGARCISPIGSSVL